MTVTDGLRYIDSDGHILEHPTAMPDYAPAKYRDRIWHVETDEAGEEWLVYNGDRTAGQRHVGRRRGRGQRRGPGPGLPRRDALHRDPARGLERQGPPCRTWTRTTSIWPCCIRPCCSVCRASADVDFAEAQARAYNDWCSDHVQEGEGRLFGAGAVPPMHEPEDVARVAAEIRRVAELPGMVSVFMRPNPAVDWRPFNDPVYDPIWQAAADTGLPIALHPFLAPDLPGACMGLRLARPRRPDGSYVDDFDPDRRSSTRGAARAPRAAPEHALHPGDRQPVRRHELHRLSLGRRGVRAVPRGQVHLPGGQRRLAGALAGAPRPPLPEVPVGGPRPVDAALGVLAPAVLDQLRPRRGDAAHHRRLAARRRRPHHLGVGLPAPRRQVPRRDRRADRGPRGLTFEQKRQITSESAIALYGIGR